MKTCVHKTCVHKTCVHKTIDIRAQHDTVHVTV